MATGGGGAGTIGPGVYWSSSSLGCCAPNNPVTLNAFGNPNATFIFIAGSTLTTSTGATFVLSNGTQACNVFWIVGSSATLGTGTQFVGTIYANNAITTVTGTNVIGRLYAFTAALTLGASNVTAPTCTSATAYTQVLSPHPIRLTVS